MAREIIQVQVGQCGNQIGNEFWSRMGAEHKVGVNGKFKGKPDEDCDYQQRLDKIQVYYRELGTMQFVPRACLVDLDPGIMDVIKASSMGALFKPANMCCGASGTGNNWDEGHHNAGAHIMDEVLDTIRRETEGCDCPQGFQITHSIAGGTGGGMGTLLLLKIRDNYPDRIISTFSVYPSPKVSDVVVEPYNATLSIHQLLENSDQTFVIDNEALFAISHNVLKQKEPKYADLNWVISMTMLGATASLRFNSKLNDNLRKMATNLVPFPRLHFFLMAQAPLFAPGQGDKVNWTVLELTDQMWSSRNFLSNVKAEDSKYLTASCMLRGSIVGAQEVDPLDEIAKIQVKMGDDFVKWIPDNIKSDILWVSPEGTNLAATLVANSTAIKGVFERIGTQFAKLYKSKVLMQNMGEGELIEADKNVRDLIIEYQDNQDAVFDYDDYDDDEEEEEEDEEEDEDEEEEDEDL